jgi:hypothetical protein
MKFGCGVAVDDVLGGAVVGTGVGDAATVGAVAAGVVPPAIADTTSQPDLTDLNPNLVHLIR